MLSQVKLTSVINYSANGKTETAALEKVTAKINQDLRGKSGIIVNTSLTFSRDEQSYDVEDRCTAHVLLTIGVA